MRPQGRDAAVRQLGGCDHRMAAVPGRADDVRFIRDRLRDHIAGREVSCAPKGADEYRRTLAICRLAGEDLNGWLVRARPNAARSRGTAGLRGTRDHQLSR